MSQNKLTAALFLEHDDVKHTVVKKDVKAEQHVRNSKTNIESLMGLETLCYLWLETGLDIPIPESSERM